MNCLGHTVLGGTRVVSLREVRIFKGSEALNNKNICHCCHASLQLIISKACFESRVDCHVASCKLLAFQQGKISAFNCLDSFLAVLCELQVSCQLKAVLKWGSMANHGPLPSTVDTTLHQFSSPPLPVPVTSQKQTSTTKSTKRPNSSD